MGMFDSTIVPCPNCGKPVEFQSKEGVCQMEVYTLETAPPEILISIMNDPAWCRDCGGWFALIDPKYPPGEKPKLDLVARLVKTPEHPVIHSQGMRWWPDDKPFTFEDLA